MYPLNTDIKITGYLLEEAISIPEDIFGRDQDIYQATIITDEPDVREQIEQACIEAAGPNTNFVFESQPSDKSALRFESIRRPNQGKDEHGNGVQIGEHVELDVRIELKETSDGEVAYSNLILRSIWLAEEAQLSDEYWENFEENGFNF